MNLLYFAMLTGSIALLIFHDPNAVLSSMIDGARGAITLCVTLLAIYCVWMSILKIVQAVKLDKAITRLFRPLTHKLFQGESPEALQYISMNLSANLLGMGGIATPLGIKAIESMTKNTRGITSKKRKFSRALPLEKSLCASDNMILFTVINCTSIQLIPTTIIGLRVSAGSSSSADIILPSLIATCCSTLIGVALCYIFRKHNRSPK